MFKMDNPQGPTVKHMELCSMLCGNLDGRGVWGKMDTCICMAESLLCSPETVTTLFVNWLCMRAQLCPTLCNPMDCNPSSVHGIFQARILELPFPPPGDLPDPGFEPASPAFAGRYFTAEPLGKP